ncbi:MAG: hypothetical protein ABI573_05360 [Chloroflexota bacterium]
MRLSSMLVLALTLALAVAACGGGGTGPTPSPTPTAPPVGSPGPAVTTPAQAATRVGETDQRFLGIAEQSSALIGASAWWTAEATADGGFRVTFTSGWGDCPAGCINKHNWLFEVSAAGVVTSGGESGDPVPAR